MEKRFKNTTFKKDYDKTFKEFKESHKNIFEESEMKEAYAVATSKPEKVSDAGSDSKSDDSKK